MSEADETNETNPRGETVTRWEATSRVRVAVDVRLTFDGTMTLDEASKRATFAVESSANLWLQSLGDKFSKASALNVTPHHVNMRWLSQGYVEPEDSSE
jgi:hypothetical protein